MSNVKAHCVPMALVVKAVCVCLLQAAYRLQPVSVGMATMQLLDIGYAGMPAIGTAVFSEIGSPRKS